MNWEFPRFVKIFARILVYENEILRKSTATNEREIRLLRTFWDKQQKSKLKRLIYFNANCTVSTNVNNWKEHVRIPTIKHDVTRNVPNSRGKQIFFSFFRASSNKQF